MIDFWRIIIILICGGGLILEKWMVFGCESLHSKTHGVNLVCCDLVNNLVETCEYSSFCKEHCSCFITITKDLDCFPKSNDSQIAPFKWLDHQSNPSHLSCAEPNLPNPTVPYTVVIEDSNERLTHQFLVGMCGMGVTSLTLQSYSKLFDLIDFSACFPDLASFQIVSVTRKSADFTKSLKNLKNLSILSLVNIDFEFWISEPPFIKTLNYLHIENSSLSEIPKWFSKADQLTTVNLKNTLVASLSSLVNLPAVRSLRLSYNMFNNLHQFIFVSKMLIHLDLSHNQISSFSSHTFRELIDLRVLDLSSNPIKMLSYKPFAKNSRLKWLKLSKTEITNLNPDHFFGLTSLKTLTLSKMPLHNISPYAFVPLKNLRYLDMDSCNLTRIPHSVVYNCHLTKLNLANNKFHRSSSLPPEVMAGLSGLAQLRIEGNPLIEFPPSFLLISHQNHRLLRFLLHSTMTLPVWTSEPCTPYYWAMQMENRTSNLRHFLSQYSNEKMLKNGLDYCKEQYNWMVEQMDVYRELEKNSGCYTQRRLRSSIITSNSVPAKNTTSIISSKNLTNVEFLNLPQPFPQILIVSISVNFLLILILLSCTVIGCNHK